MDQLSRLTLGRTTPFIFILIFILMSSLTGCVSIQHVEKQSEFIEPASIPKTPREMRGVWVATVDNIDWPSKPGLPVEQQKAELIGILDKAEKLNLNAVVFQIRPASDALYDSPIEPWSYYLTGK